MKMIFCRLLLYLNAAEFLAWLLYFFDIYVDCYTLHIQGVAMKFPEYFCCET